MRYLATLLTLSLLICLPAGAALAAEAPGTGGIGVRLVDIPASAQGDPRARAYIVDNLKPGSTIERRIEVQNNTGTRQTVKVYPGAARIDNNSFTVEDEDVANDLTRWTSVTAPELAMAPGESARVPVTITVPQDAPEGEQYGVIWAQIQADRAPGSSAIQVSRAGIRIYLSVGAGNGRAADLTVDALTASRNEAGKPLATAKVTNIGGRALDITGSLTLKNGPANISAGPFPVLKGTTIAPGASADVSVVLDTQLPNGPWDATMKITSGTLNREGTATLTFPNAGTTETVVIEQPGIPSWVWPVGGLAFVLIAAASVLVFRGRHGTGR